MLVKIIEIIGWRENSIDYTGWAEHKNTELKKRLRKSMNSSPGEIKEIVRKIKAKDCFLLPSVRETEIEGVTQLLHAMGADLKVKENE